MSGSEYFSCPELSGSRSLAGVRSAAAVISGRWSRDNLLDDRCWSCMNLTKRVASCVFVPVSWRLWLSRCSKRDSRGSLRIDLGDKVWHDLALIGVRG